MTRELLPNRRAAEAMDFTFRGAPYRVCAGFFPDGRLAEIFVDRCDKSGNDSGDDAKDASVAVSLALQHGTPVDTIRHAVSRTREGEPLGLIGAALDLLVSGEAR